MIAKSIAFVVSNLPAFLFVAALLIAAFRRAPQWSTPERFLSWILLLPIGGWLVAQASCLRDSWSQWLS